MCVWVTYMYPCDAGAHAPSPCTRAATPPLRRRTGRLRPRTVQTCSGGAAWLVLPRSRVHRPPSLVPRIVVPRPHLFRPLCFLSFFSLSCASYLPHILGLCAKTSLTEISIVPMMMMIKRHRVYLIRYAHVKPMSTLLVTRAVPSIVPFYFTTTPNSANLHIAKTCLRYIDSSLTSIKNLHSLEGLQHKC